MSAPSTYPRTLCVCTSETLSLVIYDHCQAFMIFFSNVFEYYEQFKLKFMIIL